MMEKEIEMDGYLDLRLHTLGFTPNTISQERRELKSSIIFIHQSCGSKNLTLIYIENSKPNL